MAKGGQISIRRLGKLYYSREGVVEDFKGGLFFFAASEWRVLDFLKL